MNRFDPIFFTPPHNTPDRRRRLFKSGGGDNYYENQDRLLGVQADAALELLNAGKPYLSDAVSSFATESKKFSDPAYEEKMVGQAGADAQQAIASNAEAAKRGLERFGINPNSGRFATMTADNAIRGAALETGAKNTARNQVEKMKLASSKDFYSSLVGQQSDAASQVGNSASAYGNMGNAQAQNQNAEMSTWGQAAGTGLGIAADNNWFAKDGGKVGGWRKPKIKRALGGGAGQGLFNTGNGSVVTRPSSPTSSGNLMAKGMNAAKLGMNLQKAVPNVLGKVGDKLAMSSNPTLSNLGMSAQNAEVMLGNTAVPVIEGAADGAAAATAAEATNIGMAGAGMDLMGGTAAAAGGTAASLAPVAAALPWVAGALAIGSMFDMFKDGGEKVSIQDRIQHAVERASQETGIDQDILHNLIKAESSGNPKAVSRVGAVGLVQLMPGTAKQYGVKDRFDIEQNVMGGARYLRDLAKQTKGDMIAAVGNYNSGPAHYLRTGNISPNRETYNHVAKVFGQEALSTLPPLRKNREKRSGLPRKPMTPEGAMTLAPSADIPVRNFAPEVTQQTLDGPSLIDRPASLPMASPMLPNLGDTATASPMLASTLAAAPKPSVYRIRKGDTLSGIASAHGVTVADMMAANPHIKDANVIRAGDALRLAEGGKVDPLAEYMKGQGWSHGEQDKKAVYETLFKAPYTGAREQDAKILEVFKNLDAEDAESGKWDRLDKDSQGLKMADGGRADMTQGGEVSGPGTPTSDSVPAALSDGEFVENAEAVAMSRAEVAPVVDAWKRGDGDAEALLGAINDAGLEKRYGDDDDGKRQATFLTEARDLVEGIRSLPHGEASMPVLEESYYRLAASKPDNPSSEEQDAIAEIKTAIAVWLADQRAGASEVKRGLGGASFFGGLMRGFDDGQAISARYRDARQRKEFQKAVGDAMSKSETEAAQSGKTVNVLDTGAVDKADLGAGGGTYAYADADAAKSAYAQAKDIEDMQRDPEFSAAFHAKPNDRGVQTFQIPDLTTVETKPLEPINATAESVHDAHNADLLQSELAKTPLAKPDQQRVTMPAMELPEVTLQEPKNTQPANPFKPSGIRLTQTATRARTADDVFASKYVPGIQSMLMKQGRIKEADAFGEWAKDKERAAYGRTWSNAAMKYMAGDTEGAIKASKDIYDRMIPDGLYAETIPGEGGKYTVNFRDEKTNTIVRTHQASAADLSKLAIGALSPMEQFNSWWKMQEAEREAKKPNLKVVGDVLIDAKTGGVVFDARKDKEATGYAAELAGAVKGGKIAQEKADKLYVDYLEKRASQSGGVTIQNTPFVTEKVVGPDGKVRFLIGGGNAGMAQTIDTDVVDPKFVNERADKARKMLDDVVTQAKEKAAGAMDGVDELAIQGTIDKAIKADPGVDVTKLIGTAIQQAQYKEYIRRWDEMVKEGAKNDSVELNNLTARYRKLGVLAPDTTPKPPDDPWYRPW